MWFMERFRKIRLPGMKHEVVVIAHQAVGQHLGIEEMHALGDDGQQGLAVGIVHEDRLAPVASRSDVIDRAGEFDAKRSGHGVGKVRGRGQKARPDLMTSRIESLLIMLTGLGG